MSRYDHELAREASLIAQGHRQIARELASLWTRLLNRLGF